MIFNELFQSTRPVRGATDGKSIRAYANNVSIHAPRAGRDYRLYRRAYNDHSFNPRAPCGARPQSQAASVAATGFNPRAPCGARPWMLESVVRPSAFQSTRPVRGATVLYMET